MDRGLIEYPMYAKGMNGGACLWGRAALPSWGAPSKDTLAYTLSHSLTLRGLPILTHRLACIHPYK